MKFTYLVFILFASLSFSSCKKDTVEYPKEILGEWKLIAEKEWTGLPDPSFEPVQSNKTIKFSSDGTYESNGDMCTMSTQSNGQTSGYFYESLSSIEPDGCQSAAASSGIKYSFEEGFLIVFYPCIEGCYQKYERI